MSEVTLKITNPHTKGEVVKSWQREVKELFARVDIDCPIKVDGTYGLSSRSFTASLCEAYGMLPAEVMQDGVTPELRIRLRNRQLTRVEKRRFDARVDYRRRLRERWDKNWVDVALPVRHIVQHSWGFHPGVHDGVDVITDVNPKIFAVIKSKVIDVRASGWWGLGAPKDQELKAKGDGIIQLEVLESIGPFKKGIHIGYGHAEKATVKVGDIVDAGDVIGRAGLANAWHIHWMFNTGKTSKGIGNLDPAPFLEYLIKHAR